MSAVAKEIVYQYRARDLVLAVLFGPRRLQYLLTACCGALVVLWWQIAPWWVELPLAILALLVTMLACTFLVLWRKGLLYKNVTLRVAGDALEVQTVLARSSWAWEDVRRCDQTLAGLQLQVGPQSLLVPLHAFANLQERVDFVTAIQAARAAATQRPPEPLPEPGPGAATYSVKLRRVDLFVFALKRRWQSWLFWLVCAALGWGWAVWQDRGSPWPSETLGLVIMAVPVALLAAFVFGPLDALLRLLPIRRDHPLINPFQVSFDGTGLQIVTVSAHSQVAWAAVREVKRTWGGGIRVMYRSGTGLPLPRRAFSSAQHRADLLQRVAAWRAAAKQ